MRVFSEGRGNATMRFANDELGKESQKRSFRFCLELRLGS